jgi:hypothetical protein
MRSAGELATVFIGTSAMLAERVALD